MYILFMLMYVDCSTSVLDATDKEMGTKWEWSTFYCGTSSTSIWWQNFTSQYYMVFMNVCTGICLCGLCGQNVLCILTSVCVVI